MSRARGVAARGVPRGARAIGDRSVPEDYGQPKTGGTGFLGTPSNHIELLRKRPLSPDVFASDSSWRAHYDFPIAALSSITNRVSGVVLSAAVASCGVASAIAGPEAVPHGVEALKSVAPALAPTVKFALSFPFVFHFLGGARHLVWDTTLRGINNKSARASSIALFGVSAVVAAALAAYSW